MPNTTSPQDRIPILERTELAQASFALALSRFEASPAQPGATASARRESQA
ncbi:MAG: hypothetical protein GY788_23415 [bacterium]|nr:hypothetical protein [bacterium]